MSKIKRLLLGFFLAVLWTGASLLYAEELSPNAVPSQNAVSPAPEETTSGSDGAVQSAEEEVRDPFAFLVEPEAPAPTPGVTGPEIVVALEGIGFGSKDAYAVIGGEVFYEGDEKNGIKLLEVRRREVDVLVNGGTVTIPLFPAEDLQRSKDRAKKKSAMENTTAEPVSGTPSSLSEREQPQS